VEIERGNRGKINGLKKQVKKIENGLKYKPGQQQRSKYWF
jgi:hypothetical protein